ncbi:hypothetical protein [Hydrogenophaga sp. T2]
MPTNDSPDLVRYTSTEHDTSHVLINPTSGLIRDAKGKSQDVLGQITKLLRAPKAQPCSLEVCEALLSGLREIQEFLIVRSHAVDELIAALQTLADSIQDKLGQEYTSSLASLKGLRSKHPVWCALADEGFVRNGNYAKRLYIGCASALAISTGEPVSKSLAQYAASLHRLEYLDRRQLRLVLSTNSGPGHSENGEFHEDVAALRRIWAKVIKVFGSTEPPPPQTTDERVRGQILSAALNATSRHMGGAAHHRLLGPDQFNKALSRIVAELAVDNLEGALGFLVMRTGLSIDVAGALPLRREPVADGRSFIDVDQGVAVVDLNVIANEASKPLVGSIPAGHRLRVHLPITLQSHLKARLQVHSNAQNLAELYPESRVPESRARIYPSRDELEPSWARLRYSLGWMLRNQGINKLHAAFLSGDFAIIPRSKLHYAAVSAQEWHVLQQWLHEKLGFDEPVAHQLATELGIGCAVVPRIENVRLHDALLVEAVTRARPAKNTTVTALLAFHNAFTKLTGWRLAVLLALREQRSIDLDASIGDVTSSWVAIHDKSVRSDRGHQPVALSGFAAMCVRLYKLHCDAIAKRIEKTIPTGTPFTRWCRSVAGGQNVRLLSLVLDDQQVHVLRSSDFTGPQWPGYVLAPDCGRKIMEHELRNHGARSSDVDAHLRHFTQGQQPASPFDPSVMSTIVRRISIVQQKVAVSIFRSPVVGLSKGFLRVEALELGCR